MHAELLTGAARAAAIETIKGHHYTRSVPSGKSYYFAAGPVLVVWSLPANPNLARFVLGRPGVVWELSRLWAPDGHAPDALTKAIAVGVKALQQHEAPEALVSYADPAAGHRGGVYRAAGWTHHGTSSETRTYRDADGRAVARRAFHSGGKSLSKAEIEARGFVQHNLPGKERFVKVLRRPTVSARVLLAAERVTTPETARDIGQRLLAVKRSLPHGQFKKWLAANCAFSYRTAARYMKGATVAPLPAARSRL